VNDKYIFTSDRLGFRNWHAGDLAEFARMNADVDVMEHFPKPLTQHESAELMERLQDHYEKHGYTYFVAEIKKTGTFIGFIGLAYQEFETEFTPATDIGWRLKKAAWGKGYATEGAKRCLAFAFKDLKLERVISTCTISNTNSENVMRKIGMAKKGAFKHPELSEYPNVEQCIWYEIGNKEVV
jgi:RimJ/RimL family protein N-acetyltransferase